MDLDFIFNGQGHGSLATTLIENNFDPNTLRPWRGEDGRSYCTRIENGQPKVFLTNAPTTLRKDEWKQLDMAVHKAAQKRMRVFGDIRSAGLTYSIPNGMGKTVLESERESDISDAVTSMDGIQKADADRLEFDLVNLPLPIIHKDFHYSARQLATSRNSGQALDTSHAELAARKVSEQVEKMTLGEASSFTYGGGTIYGFTNFPSRLTKTLTAPSSANHATTVNEVLDMRAQAYADNHYGPFMLYASPGWDEYLDEDYSTAKGSNTLRSRLKMIEGIIDVRTAHFLSDTQLVLVQMTPDVVRAVIGMDVTVVQWESQGGMMLNYKVMAILVPQLRADYNANTGIVHGSV